MTPDLTIVSHHLCPYVQRAAIALAEKQIPFRRVDIDLKNKPAWFTKMSPLGKVPLLRVEDSVIFESAVILEFLEETQPGPLHPQAPLKRAEHRSWIEFGSAILNSIAAFYNAKDAQAFEQSRDKLAAQFALIEAQLGNGPWFDGSDFSLVDAAYGPNFRYFDVFDTIADFEILADLPKVTAWRELMSKRPSIENAVEANYPARLLEFLKQRGSYLSDLIAR